ncbi:hypothetical protein [Litoreibacter roseus]|uniref:Uncharacterized protein n=1 Tax=Litoreibacter roseus TaxID=2601869 RepID=A0A6N6JEY3_9RHOB|nr:hypothetical protein [Litoreibacter roseus]GFE64705.1 hypothetical protein KIN_17790 [Litoreibacter roseus]
MTVFSISGYKITSDELSQVTTVAPSTLDVVMRTGVETLDFAYVEIEPDSAAISLSDYNLVMDGVHVNDAPQPDRVEIFGLSASDQGQTNVICFGFNNENGTVTDQLFSISDTPLPDMSTPDLANSTLANAFMTRLDHTDMPDGFSISLPQIDGVEVSGVLMSMFEAEDPTDRFDFRPMEDDGSSMPDLGLIFEQSDPLADTEQAPEAADIIHVEEAPDIFIETDMV